MGLFSRFGWWELDPVPFAMNFNEYDSWNGPVWRIFCCEVAPNRAFVAICAMVLQPSRPIVHTRRMVRWKSTIRELSAEARLHLYARSLSRRAKASAHHLGIYGACALIAMLVFGTLSAHSF
ncbi:hypothetical protein ACWAUC_18645 [Bradyrhizobium guangdongense]